MGSSNIGSSKKSLSMGCQGIGILFDSKAKTHFRGALKNILFLSLALLSSLLFLACFGGPFREVWYHTLPKHNLRYYAMHVRFSNELLRYFAERGCKLNSAESWTVYFSRDPDSYTPYGKAYIPNHWSMMRNSDLKLFLPKFLGSDVLKVERQTDFFSSYPVITSLAKRPYSLSKKKLKAIKNLQKGVEQRFFAKKQGPPPLDLKKLGRLPKVVDQKGLIRSKPFGKDPETNLYEDLAKGDYAEYGSRWPPPVIEKKNSLLQQAKEGMHFLNYMLMHGVDENDEYVRIELWNLPIIFPDLEEQQFQYLGELEIGKYWDKASKEGGQWQLRYDYWGRANLDFRVNDKFFYWQPYLEHQLSGVQRDQFQNLRIDLQEQQRGLRPKFVANLLQNIAERNFWGRFPYIRMISADNKNCQF